MVKAGFLVLFYIFTAICALAQTATIFVPEDCVSIQSAINRANNGDTIIVMPGTYVENIDFLGKAITVKSEKGADVTVIDGNQADSVVTLENGEGNDSILKGFTITNGFGLGINGKGGGILCIDTSPIILDNIIKNNTSDWGAGIFCGGSAIITNNIIMNNDASRNGGGISCKDLSKVINNEISNNNAFTAGGGVACSGYSEVIDNVISDNSSGMSGGGVDCSDTTTVRSNKINRNNSKSGAGIRCDYSDAEISDNIICDNISRMNGGGIACSSGSPKVRRNYIYRNSASYAGGLDLSDCSVFVNRNIIYENEGSSGGGVICDVSFHKTIVLTNNIIAKNKSGWGGGILVSWVYKASVIMVNNTIVDNNATIQGGGVCGEGYSEIINTIIWNNDAPQGAQIYGGGSVSYSNVQGGWPGPGNIDADPFFIDTRKNDYHIKYDSSCKNAGDPSFYNILTMDYDGDPRYEDGFIDIGADEFHEHLYHVGNVRPGGNVDIRVVGNPGASPVRLLFSFDARHNPQMTTYGKLYLVQPIHEFILGGIQSNGVFSYSGKIPSWWSKGDEYYIQAMVGPLGGFDTVLTNAHVLRVVAP